MHNNSVVQSLKQMCLPTTLITPPPTWLVWCARSLNIVTSQPGARANKRKRRWKRANEKLEVGICNCNEKSSSHRAYSCHHAVDGHTVFIVSKLNINRHSSVSYGYLAFLYSIPDLFSIKSGGRRAG
jgi:hypothetical protein